MRYQNIVSYWLLHIKKQLLLCLWRLKMIWLTTCQSGTKTTYKIGLPWETKFCCFLTVIFLSRRLWWLQTNWGNKLCFDFVKKNLCFSLARKMYYEELTYIYLLISIFSWCFYVISMCFVLALHVTIYLYTSVTRPLGCKIVSEAII